MKSKVFLILIALVVLFFCKVDMTYAQMQQDSSQINEQIRIIKEKIIKLQEMMKVLKSQQSILADSYLVMDISNNSLILEKNKEKTYSIASITKLMNAVVALENINKDQSIKLTNEMLKPYGYSPSLFLNSNVRAEDLLKASLIQSTNDAAESLSYFIGNEKFLEMMNQKAKELGMTDTYFYDVYGMNLNNRSTVKDLAKLLSYINNNHPDIWEATKNDNFWLPDATGRMLKFKNMNIFYNKTEFIGGKTGYLKEAKQSIVSLFKLNGKTISIILLHSGNSQSDTLKIINNIKSGIIS